MREQEQEQQNKDREAFNQRVTMPSIAQEHQDPISSKKRRRDDGEIQMKLSSPRLNKESSSPSSTRRYIPVKSSKRQRFDPPPPAMHFLDTPSFEHNSSHTHSYIRGKDNTAGYFPIQDNETVKEQEKDKKKDLSPCHVCHRRPTKMQELDNFVDCEGCGGRTCWICVRECGGRQREAERVLDWGDGGHRRVVCSRCCVEKGTEGEVWCLGCLRSEGDG